MKLLKDQVSLILLILHFHDPHSTTNLSVGMRCWIDVSNISKYSIIGRNLWLEKRKHKHQFLFSFDSSSDETMAICSRRTRVQNIILSQCSQSLISFCLWVSQSQSQKNIYFCPWLYGVTWRNQKTIVDIDGVGCSQSTGCSILKILRNFDFY